MSIKTTIGLLSLLASPLLQAGTMGPEAPALPWFATIGTGYSWSLKPNMQVQVDALDWDFSAQGYDGSIGNAGFYSFEIGKAVHKYVALSLSYIDQENYHYQKFQTASNPSDPAFTGSQRHRYFTLNNKDVLINAFIHPATYWTEMYSLEITPFIGVGIGLGHNEVSDFHTVGVKTAGGVNIGSVSSIGDSESTNSFAWQGSVGLHIQPQQSHLSANIGYRYLDGGTFNCPGVIFSNIDGIAYGKPWNGDAQFNQLFVEFQYTV